MLCLLASHWLCFFFLTPKNGLILNRIICIHIVLCVGRGIAALLSLNFLYFVPSIEFIQMLIVLQNTFMQGEQYCFKSITLLFLLCFLNMYFPQGIQSSFHFRNYQFTIFVHEICCLWSVFVIQHWVTIHISGKSRQFHRILHGCALAI